MLIKFKTRREKRINNWSTFQACNKYGRIVRTVKRKLTDVESAVIGASQILDDGSTYVTSSQNKNSFSLLIVVTNDAISGTTSKELIELSYFKIAE